MKETRIRLVPARAGETLDALARRANAAWMGQEMAVANGLTEGHRLREGQLIKVAVAEPYQARPRR